MIKKYLLLTKPGIIMGNAITCIGGFALASRGEIHYALLFLTLLGLSLIVGAGSVSNNYMDRHYDAKMARTQNRPLAKGSIKPFHALLFAVFLTLCGGVVLGVYVNLLTVILSLIGFAVYVAFYSVIKYHTVHATLIGSVAGAVPPVVGYCAVSNRFDVAALILFLMIATWQMPHFYAIAVYRFKDYNKASIPVLPVIRGMKTTKVHMMLYIVGFMSVSFLLPILHFVGNAYLIAMALLSVIWLWLCVRGFKCADETRWARKMFIYSLAVVLGLCIMIPFTVVKKEQEIISHSNLSYVCKCATD